MTEILCPVCGKMLSNADGSVKCENGHSFDISRKGYVNLLPPSGSGHHGDDKLMVKARTRFLSAGYYDELSDEICSLILKYMPDGGTVIDAGCGEGKYICDIRKALLSEARSAELVGFDISKDAINALASRSRDIRAYVASTSDMPVPDGSADVLLNIFSPFFSREFPRVIKPGGVLVRVIPDTEHLWELKEKIYDTPYKNPPAETDIEGFAVEEIREVKYTITLPDRESVNDLFMMTPYYYKTGRNDQEKLQKIDSLAVSLEFVIGVYRPNGKMGVTVNV